MTLPLPLLCIHYITIVFKNQVILCVFLIFYIFQNKSLNIIKDQLRLIYNRIVLSNFTLQNDSITEYITICSNIFGEFSGAQVYDKNMAAKMASNVNAEKMLIVKILPLFIKNLAMKAIFNIVGERKSCITISNLGVIDLPDEMKPFISRFDFILGVQAVALYNCGVASFKDSLYINFIRGVQETGLEYRFFKVLQEDGLSVQAQSNHGGV